MAENHRGANKTEHQSKGYSGFSFFLQLLTSLCVNGMRGIFLPTRDQTYRLHWQHGVLTIDHQGILPCVFF